MPLYELKCRLVGTVLGLLFTGGLYAIVTLVPGLEMGGFGTLFLVWAPVTVLGLPWSVLGFTISYAVPALGLLLVVLSVGINGFLLGWFCDRTLNRAAAQSAVHT